MSDDIVRYHLCVGVSGSSKAGMLSRLEDKEYRVTGSDNDGAEDLFSGLVLEGDCRLPERELMEFARLFRARVIEISEYSSGNRVATRDSQNANASSGAVGRMAIFEASTMLDKPYSGVEVAA